VDVIVKEMDIVNPPSQQVRSIEMPCWSNSLPYEDWRMLKIKASFLYEPTEDIHDIHHIERCISIYLKEFYYGDMSRDMHRYGPIMDHGHPAWKLHKHAQPRKPVFDWDDIKGTENSRAARAFDLSFYELSGEQEEYFKENGRVNPWIAYTTAPFLTVPIV
jgi:hypothetical protein